MRRIIFLTWALFSFLLCGLTRTCADAGPLSNLGNVYVDIQLEGDAAQAGLDKATLQAHVESRLRLAGVKVVDAISSGTIVFTEKVSLVAGTPNDNYGGFIQTTLMQTCVITGQHDTSLATTYEDISALSAGKYRIRDVGMQVVDSELDYFTNLYMKDNPVTKEGAESKK